MKYDAIIIGSGQGGNPPAHRLPDLGWTAALVEKAYLGAHIHPTLAEGFFGLMEDLKLAA